MKLKKQVDTDVLTAARYRIQYTFDNFEKILVSFSGGKDSTVMLHLVAEEAKKRNRQIGVMLIDFEAQYQRTVEHCQAMFEEYRDCIDLHWVCLPIKLRNAASNFEPVWTCWEWEKRDQWVREFPNFEGVINNEEYYPFFQDNMEFEEFVPLFSNWYSEGKPLATFVGIRCDESLNRFRTIALYNKVMHGGNRWTTEVLPDVFNIYPLYDWRSRDVWIYHSKYPEKRYNTVYDLMHQAGLPLGNQRLCQPYGDDQRRGLWLYHILEPQTWSKVVSRVNGANSLATYVQEKGNVTGYNKITLPPGHTYKSFCMLLLKTLPKVSRDHFIERFQKFLEGWASRGYPKDIPDYAPRELENRYWVPSWRRLCKVLLRNDWWCKGLGMTQPKSEAYGRYLRLKQKKKEEKA